MVAKGPITFQVGVGWDTMFCARTCTRVVVIKYLVGNIHALHSSDMLTEKEEKANCFMAVCRKIGNHVSHACVPPAFTLCVLDRANHMGGTKHGQDGV